MCLLGLLTPNGASGLVLTFGGGSAYCGCGANLQELHVGVEVLAAVRKHLLVAAAEAAAGSGLSAASIARLDGRAELTPCARGGALSWHNESPEGEGEGERGLQHVRDLALEEVAEDAELELDDAQRPVDAIKLSLC
jgi:hypothetical protein